MKQPFSTELTIDTVSGHIDLGGGKKIPRTLESFKLPNEQPEEPHYLIESEHYAVQKDLWEVLHLDTELESEEVASFLLGFKSEQRQVLKAELKYKFRCLLYAKEPEIVIQALQQFLEKHANAPHKPLYALKKQLIELINEQVDARYKAANNLR